MSQDLTGLMAPYAEHAVMETPAILAQFPDRDEGILRGRSEIEKLFARNFKNLARKFSELYPPACSSPTAGILPGSIRAKRRAVRKSISLNRWTSRTA